MPEQDNSPEPMAGELVQLLALAEGGRYDDLESAWMAAVENDAIGIEGFLLVLETVAPRNNPKLMESLAWFYLSGQADRHGAAAALEAAKRAAALLPESDTLREEIAGLYRAVRASAPGIETLAEMTVLRRDVPLASAVSCLEQFLRMPPGTFVSDSRRKSPGRVTGVDAGRKVLAVSFGESERAYDALSIESLELLGPDDFRALAIFDRAKLESMDPDRLVRLLLEAYGPRLGMKDLKARFTAALPDVPWSKWWTAAKSLLKRDPLIEMSEGAQPEFFLRQRPVTYEEEVRERFASAGSAEDRLLTVLDYLGEAGHDPAAEAGMLKSFAGDLAPLADPAEGAPSSDALAALAVLAEIRRHLGEGAPPLPPAAEALGAARADAAAVLGAVRSNRLAQLILTFIRENVADGWPEVFAAALPACSQDVCDGIAAELSAAGREDLLAGAVAAILRQPDRCLAAIAWLWKAAAGDRYPRVFADVNRASVTVRLLQAANNVALTDFEDKARKQELLTQARRAISAREFAVLREVLENTDAGWAKEIRLAVARNAALSDHLRVQVMGLLGQVHPAPAARIVPAWEEDVIYTTPDALERRQKEFEHLLHVKMPQNSAAIGEAAARGDVSDNAEFTTALEERDRLTERANAMQADLAKARPIPRTMAESDTVTVGTAVRARRLSTGQEESLAFLGPWDALPEKGIYFYRAPIALAFMGKQVGDTATLQTGSSQEQWEILEVRPAF